MDTEDIYLYILWIFLVVSAVWTQLWMIDRQAMEAMIVDERTPIVTRWTGSDDVFESPASNMRIIERLRRMRQIRR